MRRTSTSHGDGFNDLNKSCVMPSQICNYMKIELEIGKQRWLPEPKVALTICFSALFSIFRNISKACVAFTMDTPGFRDEHPEWALLSTKNEPLMQAGLLNICSILDIKSKLTVSFSVMLAHWVASCTDSEAICVFSLQNEHENNQGWVNHQHR